MAVYLLEQGVEKACKGLLLAVAPETNPKEHGHAALLAFLAYVRTRLDDEDVGRLYEALRASSPLMNDALTAMSNLETDATNREFRAKIASLTSAQIAELMRVATSFEQRSNAVLMILPDGITVPPVRDPSQLVNTLVGVIRNALPSKERHRADEEWIPAALAGAVNDWGLANKPFEGGMISKEEIQGGLDRQWALLAIYLLACLVLPHEESSRYPAPRGAPKEVLEAVRRRQMGVDHYSTGLGVVVEIDRLTRTAERAIYIVKRSLAAPNGEGRLATA